jgi:YfiH family protein
MLLHSDPLFSIYCGDRKESFPRAHFYSVPDSDTLLRSGQFVTAYKLMELENLIVLKQTHSDAGYVIAGPKELGAFAPYNHEGDYLVTNLSRIGLSIATADCLPIIAYDTCHNVIGIAHAGWQGSIKEIALKMIKDFETNFGTRLDHIRIFMGPSAKACCYEVKEDLIEKILMFDYGAYTLQERSGQTFFDLPLFNRLQLEAYGIDKSAFHVHYSLCTICNPSFCSNRRDGELAQRQMTIVALK